MRFYTSGLCLLIMALFASFSAYCQDSCIYRKYIVVKDSLFRSCMDSVISHSKDCIFSNESFCVSVWKYIGKNDTAYISFTTHVQNDEQVAMKELIWGEDYAFTIHQNIKFLFFYNDTSIFQTKGYYPVIVNSQNCFSYEYYLNGTTIPIQSVETYVDGEYRLYKWVPCINVDDMIVLQKSDNKVLYGYKDVEIIR